MRSQVLASSIAIGQRVLYKAPIARRYYAGHMGLTSTGRLAEWEVTGIALYARSRKYVKALQIRPVQLPPGVTHLRYGWWIPAYHFTPEMLHLANPEHPWVKWLAGEGCG